MKHLFFGFILMAFLAVTASANTAYTYTTPSMYFGASAGPTGTVDFTTTVNDCTNGSNLGPTCVDFSAGSDPGNGDLLAVQLVYLPSANGVNGESGVATAAPGTADTFGTVQLFCIDYQANAGAGALDANCSNVTLNGDLHIELDQSAPDVDGGDLIDALSGTSAGGGSLVFSATSFTLDGGVLAYALNSSTYSIDGINIIAGTSGAATPLAGTITDTTASSGVPEPANFALMGVGLMGLGFAARRKRA
jgi:hypothetical protein